MRRITAVLAALAVVASAASRDYADLYEAAMEAYAQKQYPRAIEFLEGALVECPPDSADDRYAIHLKLREISSDAGDFGRALHHGRACIDFSRPDTAVDRAYLMFPMMMQANVYSMAGDSAGAFTYLDSARMYTSDNPLYNVALHSVAGVIYNKFGNWPRAIENYRRMVDVVTATGNREEILRSLNLYGNALGNSGDYRAAADVYARQADSARAFYGERSREYLWSAQLQAHAAGFNGDYAEGARLYGIVADGYRARLTEQLRTLPSEQRQAMLETMIKVLRLMVPYGCGIGNGYPRFMRKAYESLRLTKGLLLASDRSTRAVVAEFGTDADRANLAALMAGQEHLRRLEADPTRDLDSVYTAFRRVKELDAALALSCAEYSRLTDFTDTDYDDIRLALGPDDVLLDFDDYLREDGTRRIVCFEIRRDMPTPRLHRLFDANDVDSVVALENGLWSNLYTGEAAADMERIVGRPIDSIAGPARRVFYVPSGIVHRLAPEAITVGGRLLGDSRRMRRLSSARELLAGRSNGRPRSAALFGAIDYGVRYAALPASAREIDSISAILASGCTVETFAGSDATAARLTAMSGRAPDILHIATHGFYYRPGSGQVPSELQGYADAMSLTGLAMSADTVGAAGIISASEVAAMDLGNTSLVSIASCHSAQGEVTPEGIYGLQRAFKKAGAGTLLLSLWEVTDGAASLFMTEFYRAIAAGADRYDAYAGARDAVRARYPNPYYWAPFIMVD